jgi:type IV pilus assembly protein PilO
VSVGAALPRVLRGVLVFVAVYVSVLSLYGAARWSPVVDEDERRQAHLETVRKEVRAVEVTNAKRPEFEREAALLAQKLETLDTILPHTAKMAELTTACRTLAARDGLTLLGVTAQPVVARDFYWEMPLAIDVRGRPDDIARFTAHLRNLRRLLVLGGITAEAEPGGDFAATIRASAFRY